MRRAKGLIVARPTLGDRGLHVAACACVAIACAILAPAAFAWTPEPATYGVGEVTNQSIRVSDGTVLNADVYYPTDKATGKEAAGPFPVLLTQTPYGQIDTSDDPYLVERGYIEVISDVRGTGGSTGEFSLFDPQQGVDGAAVVNWAAKLPHATGLVGLQGFSYLGIDQFATAADAGPAHVKAMFPVVSGNEIYRDTAFAGGFPDIEFDAYFLGGTSALSLFGPVAEADSNEVAAEEDHIHDLSDFDASLLGNVEVNGSQAYDESYWIDRSPASYIAKIVHDRIPAFLIGGWYDLFQRGEPLNYASFQNASDGRALLAPMSPSQRVTPRYQLLTGPWFHVTVGDGLDYHGLNLDELQLAWYDHWLKGIDTGITDTTTPLHLENLATGQYDEFSDYPVNNATPTAYYLHAGGGLSATAPTDASAPDLLVFTGTEIPCTSSTTQWLIGEPESLESLFGLKDPCATNAVLSQLGPGTENYTTAPFTRPTALAGPIGATLYATSTTKDTEWVVQVSDVAPDGTSTPLTSGLLEGNQRALDPSMTWYGADGKPILPWHPYTQAAVTSVVPGQVTRYDVEVFPTFDTLETGHRLRITIATSDFPHAVPTVIQQPNLIGGVYELDHDPQYPSSVELPLLSPAATAALSSTPATPLGCPAASGRLSGTDLGPVRLGMTRAAARAGFVKSSDRGRKYEDFFCLTPNGIRVGYGSPTLLRSLPTHERAAFAGRVVWASTANTSYGLRGVRPGAHLSLARKRLKLSGPFHVGLNDWYLAPNGSSTGVLKVRGRIVEEIGIADKQLTGGRAADEAFLRSFS